MTKKAKTQNQILIEGIKDLHPMHQGYLIDRLEESIKELSEQLPEWAASQASKNSMFHPNFFVEYINSMNRIFDEMDIAANKNLYPNKTIEFKPRPKFPYFD